MSPPFRPAAQRRQEAHERLERDVDAWITTANEGMPFLAPLSFLWDGATLLLAIPTASPTSRGGRDLMRDGGWLVVDEPAA